MSAGVYTHKCRGYEGYMLMKGILWECGVKVLRFYNSKCTSFWCKIIWCLLFASEHMHEPGILIATELRIPTTLVCHVTVTTIVNIGRSSYYINALTCRNLIPFSLWPEVVQEASWKIWSAPCQAVIQTAQPQQFVPSFSWHKPVKYFGVDLLVKWVFEFFLSNFLGTPKVKGSGHLMAKYGQKYSFGATTPFRYIR